MTSGGGGGGGGDGLGEGILSLSRWMMRMVSRSLSGVGDLSLRRSTMWVSMRTSCGGEGVRSTNLGLLGAGETLRRRIMIRSSSCTGLGLRGRRRSMVSTSLERSTSCPASRLGSSRRKAGVRSRSRMLISVSSYSRTGARLWGGLLRRSSRRSYISTSSYSRGGGRRGGGPPSR
jgi:hypothetical protein